MKVKITNATKKTYWYAGMIGSIIDVIEPTIYKDDYDSLCGTGYILKSDCIVIPEPDPIVESVINQFKTRSEIGIKKYGTTLERNDLSTLDWLKHLQEEMMDAVLYIEKLKSEL